MSAWTDCFVFPSERPANAGSPNRPEASKGGPPVSPYSQLQPAEVEHHTLLVLTAPPMRGTERLHPTGEEFRRSIKGGRTVEVGDLNRMVMLRAALINMGHHTPLGPTAPPMRGTEGLQSTVARLSIPEFSQKNELRESGTSSSVAGGSWETEKSRKHPHASTSIQNGTRSDAHACARVSAMFVCECVCVHVCLSACACKHT